MGVDQPDFLGRQRHTSGEMEWNGSENNADEVGKEIGG